MGDLIFKSAENSMGIYFRLRTPKNWSVSFLLPFKTTPKEVSSKNGAPKYKDANQIAAIATRRNNLNNQGSASSLVWIATSVTLPNLDVHVGACLRGPWKRIVVFLVQPQ